MPTLQGTEGSRSSPALGLLAQAALQDPVQVACKRRWMVAVVGMKRWLGVVMFMATVAPAALVAAERARLHSSFYDSECPELQKVVAARVREAMKRDSRMAASLLRLHFHDCFVNGCDGSILLDDGPNFVGEKTAAPNLNSARGFEVIDDIKQEVEATCPDTVSCADILAIVARDSVALSGGPYWEVELGRRDSLTASKTAAANAIPRPTFSVPQLVASFNKVGLNERDVVALSGSHTFGKARCTSFQARLTNQPNSRNVPNSYAGPQVPFLESKYLATLQSLCPSNSDGNNTASLDPQSPSHFDNQYFKNLQGAKGLLTSDAVLHSTSGQSQQLVAIYAKDQQVFFRDFAKSMLKMGSIDVLTGHDGNSRGIIRRNCRFANTV